MHDTEKRDGGVRLRKYIDIVLEDVRSALLTRGAIADISLTGMRIIVDQYLPVNAVYTVNMKRNPFLIVRAEVRWIRTMTSETYQAGMRIVKSTEDDVKRLANFLEMEHKRLTNG